ncbi:MAG: phasin family protein [Gammaproteobacteria bacterium]|nr:phasin family protein [Gammaproteobacteria bacterium]
MNTDLLEKASRLNETLINQFGKAAEIQMETLRRYADVAMDQAQQATEVRNLDDLKTLAANQAETLKSLNDQFTSDWKAWQNYFSETRERMQRIFETETSKPSTETKTSAKTSGGNKNAA